MHNFSVDQDTKLIFRTKRRRWIFQAGGGIFVLVLYTLSCDYLLPGKGALIGLVIGSVLAILILKFDLLPMWGTFMIIDERGLFGRSDQFFYEIYWTEIVAANLFRDYLKQLHLWIATRENAHNIPLKYLDAKEIWLRIQDYLNPEILGDSAYENWLVEQEFYQDFVEANAKLTQDLSTRLRVKKKWWMTGLGWLGLVFFGGCAVVLLFTGEGGVTAVFLFIVAAFFALWVFPDDIEMDANAVTYFIPPFGRYQMRWDEIQWIEYSPNSDWMIFHSNDKKLAMIGPALWDGAECEKAIAFLWAQVQQREIETRSNGWASLKIFSKNTRVK